MPKHEPKQTPERKEALASAAASGCSKCARELETGIRPRTAHDQGCSFKKSPEKKKQATVNNDEVVATRKTSEVVEDSNEEEDDDDNCSDNDDDESTTSTKLEPPTRHGHNVDFPVSNLHKHLVCTLCKGYYRDPYTIADCLHSFCRSCLILFFRQGMRCCPTCNTKLGPDPFHTSISIRTQEVLPDRTLQEVVNKIFPYLKEKEDEDERKFYEQRGIELKPEYAHDTNNIDNSIGRRVVAAHHHGGNNHHADIGLNNDQLDIQLEPDKKPPNAHQRLPMLRNAHLRLSARTKIITLKKYLVQKLGLKDSSKSSIEILCNGDPMGDELSLTFIYRTRWFSPTKVLTLKYRLEDVEEEGGGGVEEDEEDGDKKPKSK